MATYSFLDCNASIVGIGGAVALGTGAGVAEEGITITPNGEIDSMVIGADGTPMHSLHADKSGKVVVKLLKTSPVNQKLMLMYNLQTASATNHGQNTISLTNSQTLDTITCSAVAFAKAPDLTYGKEAGLNEWLFNAGKIERILGGVA